MNELLDPRPPVDVQQAEYQRLLGYPRGRDLSGRAAELSSWARDWYASHGRPWVYARAAERIEIEGETVSLDGFRFHAPRLKQTLSAADAHMAILVAVTAGPELEQEAQRLWRAEKPDEYFFLEVFGSAVVEQLVTTTGGRLCAWAEGQGMAVLPHDSPGYPDWDVSDQSQLLRLVVERLSDVDRGRIECLDSGMLRPKKSLLGVFGVTRHVDRVKSLRDLVPCENCSLAGCDYRRAAYRRNGAASPAEVDSPDDGVAISEPAPTVVKSPLSTAAHYGASRKALARWAADRLKISRQPDGRIHATFRYDGTTCTNMGRELKFDYHVQLGPRDDGYVIEEEKCGPAADDHGHEYQCEFIQAPERLDAAIASETHLLGQPLEAVLSWQRSTSAAGCYCAAESREHKWGLVLETLHFALAQQERS